MNKGSESPTAGSWIVERFFVRYIFLLVVKSRIPARCSSRLGLSNHID